ncbi:MAG: hypothetical protein WBB31_16455 [Saprospiraceae bacterium]
MMFKIVKIGICLILIIDASISAVNAQAHANEDSSKSNWKTWGGASLELSLSKKVDLSLGYLHSENLQDSLKNSFNQGSAGLGYNFSKHFSVKGGFIITQFPSSANSTYRYFLRGSYKVGLGDKMNWTNGIQGEKHSANENRFDYRIIFITQFGLRKRLEFLGLSPSVSYWLYYNVGGSKIQYYDISGQPSVKATPDGVHRGRLILNMSSKINQMLSVSLYYIRQNEFNLFSTDRGLNVVKPSTGKITRPFSNYNVLGMSLKFNVDL